jgi:hypothetical protein
MLRRSLTNRYHISQDELEKELEDLEQEELDAKYVTRDLFFFFFCIELTTLVGLQVAGCAW